MQWYLKALRNYARFGGRASRTEYWMFLLIHIFVILLLIITDNLMGTFNEEIEIGLLSGIYLIATSIPHMALFIRRIHDSGRSGWFVLFIFIPYLAFQVSSNIDSLYILSGLLVIAGNIYSLYLSLIDSQPGTNKYGNNPKGLECLRYDK